MVNQEFFSILKRGQIVIRKWNLEFLKEAKTSRNTLKFHPVYFVGLAGGNEEFIAWSECAPILGLSDENEATVLAQLKILSDIKSELEWKSLFNSACSSVRFCMELLYQSAMASHPFSPFRNTNTFQIPINGLVWMNSDVDTMLEESIDKWMNGYSCIKFKVGALNFEEECRMILEFRKRVGDQVQIRLDANGAWTWEEALEKMSVLSQWNIHSIEQPIPKGNWKDMNFLVNQSAIPIALDEELIGIEENQISVLLETIMPKFVVIKPSLHGGFQTSERWINEATKRGIQWWVTSALESNIALNGIARWLSLFNPSLYQGLGTGGLYANNWISPLQISNGILLIDDNINWKQPW